MNSSRYGNYVVKHRINLSEIRNTLIELEHEPTGAQIMHLENDDEENFFNLCFQTWPEKSNGVAHILEHTVLCGSEKFMIRDPFFGMTRRSLNTFMNALTGSDFTCYPAATQVPKDFYNLLEVYLDAVFKPELTLLSFLQEGHRLEFLKPEDPNSPLLFKGIVFNEMKGAMATGDARMAEALMHTLYPDLTYGVNSGGDPKEIPNLTYEELKAFHAKFYHPSRCLFFFYGNLPLEKHLDFLEEHAFKGVKKLPLLPPLPKQPRFSKAEHRILSYPIPSNEDPSDKTIVGMGWLTCSILDQEELLALNVLDVVLMGTDAAPLKMALLRSNLCKQTDSIMDNEMSEIPYNIICKGCAVDSGEKLEACVRTTLTELVKEGLPQNLIEGSMHQIELSRIEITGNSSPYALSLFFRSGLLKQHGGNPEDGLKIHTLFHQLREKIKNPSYFPDLIEKHFLNNPHFVLIELQPDAALATKEIEEESAVLQLICKDLKDDDVASILKQAKKLQDYQESAKTENLEILPKVTLNDVDQKGKEFSLIEEKVGQFQLFCHPCFTNNILYADIYFDLPEIAEADLPYLRLFTLLLPQIGCGGRNYQEHLEYLLEHTGGIHVSLDLSVQAEDPNRMRPLLSLRGKSLNWKVDKLFPIFRDMIENCDFTDTARLDELLTQHFHGLESSIQHNSLRYAVNLAARGVSVPSKIINAWQGLDYFWAIKKIVSNFNENPASLIEKMQEIREKCLGLEGAHLILSCDETAYDDLKKEKLYGLSELPLKKFPGWRGDFSLEKTHSQGRITASPVAFTALLFPSVPYVHPDAAALSIASEIMENLILHQRIREQGGAYGGGAVNSVLSGQFYFYAYRDPRLKASLEAFRESIEAVANGEFDDDDIDEAKLGLFQDIDSPIAPGTRAITAYSRLRSGRTPERRQYFRHQLLTLQKKEIQEAVKQHLIPGFEKGVCVSFAAKEFLEKENALLKERALPIYPI